MVREKIKHTITKNNLINRGEHIIIGLSGGPDSMCLFHVLHRMQQEMDLTLYAVHVNHMFRPGAAEEDEEYVKKICQQMNVACETFTYDCSAIAAEDGITSEEAGRKVRYKSFRRTAEKLRQGGIPGHKIKIAVAQNSNDQAETLLFRLMRGTGVDGLAGIDYMRTGEDGTMIIRPLLDVDRKEIEAYCRDNELEPRVDHTNEQPIYTRNKIRLELIPFIEKNFNENITATINRLSKIAREDKEYLWSQAEKSYKKALIDRGVLSLERLRAMEIPIRRRVVMKTFDSVGLSQDITATQLEAADKLIEKGTTSQSIDFPADYIMEISYNSVVFKRKTSESQIHTTPEELKLKADIISAEEFSRVADIRGKGKFKDFAAFDWDLIQETYGQDPKTFELICLRTRQQKDYIKLKGIGGSKRIQDLFVDNKVPQKDRDDVYMVALDREILWLLGEDTGKYETSFKRSRYSGEYTVTEATKRVLILEIN